MKNIFTCKDNSSSLFALSTNQIIELLSDFSDLSCYLDKIMENICDSCYEKFSLILKKKNEKRL